VVAGLIVASRGLGVLIYVTIAMVAYIRQSHVIWDPTVSHYAGRDVIVAF
jgi:hypothetical protein